MNPKTDKCSFRIAIRGPFSLRTDDGSDLTPANRKERALIALLAVSPERRRSRRWLQALLWSESPPDKSSASLRRALANLKAALGDRPALLMSNRNEIWLTQNAQIVNCSDPAGHASLLELVEPPDPAFEDWLRDLRAGDPMERAAPAQTLKAPITTPASTGGTLVIIRTTGMSGCPQSAFFETLMVDVLAARFEAEGADEIYAGSEPEPDRLLRAGTVIHLELQSIADAQHWTVHLRALADQDRRFLWSGRLRLEITGHHATTGLDAQAFVSKAITQILLRYHAFRNANLSPLMIIQRAATRLYDPSPDRVRLAQTDLCHVSDGEGAAVALAWRGFANLARRLEFGEALESDESREMMRDALAKRPGNALIASIASRVALDLDGDLDHAEHFAANAMQSDDNNPYALQARTRIALLRGQIDNAHSTALMAREAANGLPHIFAWDFELGLTALAKEDHAAAFAAFKKAHTGNPQHRASLRYLLASSILTGNTAEARRAAHLLAQIEPGFKVSDLQDPDYPVLTLRRLGLAELMRDI